MINNDNYYSLNNGGLSQSKIKAYELCPNYMYRLYISGELDKGDNRNFVVGKEVDGILTEMDKFQNTVILPYNDLRSKEAREWKDEQESLGKTVLKQDEYDKVMSIAVAVQSTSIWKDIEKNYVMQDILVVNDQSLGKYFNCRYGKPDAYKIDKDGVCHLLDLKTSQTIDRRSFFYKAKDLGYFKQLKWYTDLLIILHPEITSFKYSFVVAEKSEPYRVKLFNVPNHLVDSCEAELEYTVMQIANNDTFEKEDVTWEDGVDIEEDEYEI